VSAELVAHPGPTLGFRIDTGTASVAYLPDHEPALAGVIARSSPDWISGFSLASDVDLLLHDAQYSEHEYRDRVGWGHSSIEDAVAFARVAGAARLLLFHHDPSHSDGVLDGLAATAQPASLAREGMIFEL
jgi:phosphoribosyl 1,2-cyclic phosphodiesterase